MKDLLARTEISAQYSALPEIPTFGPKGARSMYDRVLRCALFQSDRWLDLPSDTHRLVYIGFLTQADDFGNLEGGSRRLFRWMRQFAQVTGEADALHIVADLIDSDLLRIYTAGPASAEYLHLPRFKNARRYTSRKHPPSPWCDATHMSTSEKLNLENKVFNAKPAADLPETCYKPAVSPRRSAGDLLRGVGVGVGVGVKDNVKPKNNVKPKSNPGLLIIPSWLVLEKWEVFLKHRRGKRAGLTKTSAQLLLDALAQWRSEGQDPNAILEQSVRNGWTGVFPIGSKPKPGQSGIDEWLQRQEREIHDDDERGQAGIQPTAERDDGIV